MSFIEILFGDPSLWPRWLRRTSLIAAPVFWPLWVATLILIFLAVGLIVMVLYPFMVVLDHLDDLSDFWSKP